MSDLAFSHGVYDSEDNLVVPFDTEDESFLRGFQCGGLFEAMESSFDIITGMILASNAEMVMRMCEYKNYAFTAELIPGQDDWLYIRLTNNAPKPSIWKDLDV